MFLNAVNLSHGQPNYTPATFITLAGLGSAGSADGTNSEARFSSPANIAADGAGNLYVADSANHAIRKLTPVGTNWISTTLAGSVGNPGTNDGPGITAQFHHPQGIALDVNGNVYVADSYNSTIRQIVPTGTNWFVTTIAGSPQAGGSVNGTNGAARFHGPAGLAVNSAGDIFVADQQNNTIRKITHTDTNWVVTTLAGLAGFSGTNDSSFGPAKFNGPSGIAVDAANNLYVADTFNSTLRKITPGGVVSTLAGLRGSSGTGDGTNFTARFSQFFGVTVDGANNIYVADTYNATIRQIVPVNGNWVVTTIAGLTRFAGSNDGTNNLARFNQPLGIVSYGNGNLFVTESLNNTVRKITQVGTNWTVTTAAGLAGSTGSDDGSPETARFSSPANLVVDPAGNAYVTDTANHTIRKITPQGMVSTLAGLANTSGTNDGLGVSARFNKPYGIARDGGGNLYIADGSNSTIRQLKPSGANWVVSTIAGAPGIPGTVDGTNNGARFSSPKCLAADNAGNLYLADSNGKIRQISPVGTNWVVTTIANGFFLPVGIAVDSAGKLYVLDAGQAIQQIQLIGNNWVVSTIVGTYGLFGYQDGTNAAARFDTPLALAVDNAGNLYVADSNNSVIRKVAPVGTNWVVTTLGGTGGIAGSADGTGGAALFNFPQGTAVDSYGNIYVADSQNNAIRKGWLAGSLGIVMEAPSLDHGQAQLDFTLHSGNAYSFQLLEANQLNDAWTTNSAAVLVTNAPGVSYSFRFPVPNSTHFYRVQAP